MHAEDRAELRALVESGRQAALGTLEDGAPFVSMVLYALERRPGHMPSFLIYVSRLSAHTAHLLADPRASLLIMQPDTGAADPQALARATFQVRAAPIAADNPDYLEARGVYLGRLPQQEQLFGLPDFMLFRLEPGAARFIGGYARAFSLDAARIADCLGER